jgi:hypothetical protein
MERAVGEFILGFHFQAVLWIRIRIRSDPELFAGSGMNLKPNFSVKKSHFLNQIAQKLEYLAHTHTYIYIYIYIYNCM